MKKSLPKFKLNAQGEIIIIPFVHFTIQQFDIVNGKTNFRETPKIIYQYTISRERYFKNKHRFTWVYNRFCYLSGVKKYCRIAMNYYDKKTGLAIGYNTAVTKYNSAKGTLTKYENRLKQYAEKWQPTLLINDIELEPNYQKAQQKIAIKKVEVLGLLETVKQEILKINPPI